METTERENSSNNKVVLTQSQSTLQQIIESKQPDSSSFTHDVDHDDEKDTQLLTQLLSQVELLKDDGTVKPSEPLVELEPNQVSSEHTADNREIKSTGKSETRASSSRGADYVAEDVVKELKKLRKQNRTTHWLLSALIILTVAWQISEVSVLLKLKQSLSQPFRSIESMVTGVFKHPEPDDNEESST